MEGVDLMTQVEMSVKKIKEEEIVKENTKNLVDLKEKLLCLSIKANYLTNM